MCLSIKVNHPESMLAEGEHLGLEWAVTHNGIGYRCGYVRVPKGHPWHGKDYDAIDADVHGGLTFAEPDQPCDKGGADDAYWIGFDTAHLGDAVDLSLPTGRLPDTYKEFMSQPPNTIKTTAYVEAQCRQLCEQAVAAATPTPINL